MSRTTFPRYILSATSGISDFPEFLVSGVVDGVEVAYCDNSLNHAIPKTYWFNKLLEEVPQHKQSVNDKCVNNRKDFKATITILKKPFKPVKRCPHFSKDKRLFLG